MQSIEHLTQQFEQMLVVMHPGLYFKHYRRFFPLYGGLSGTLFQRSYFFLFYYYYFFKGKITIIKQKMECAFLRGGDNEPCHLQPIKNSKYCALHNFLIKKSPVKPCLRCGKGTWSKLPICNPCGANKVRVNKKYHTVIKPYNAECHRLGKIVS